MLELLVKQSTLLTKSQQKIEELEKENSTMRTTISTLSREVYSLKNSCNRRDQLLLSNSIRIFGVSVGDDEPNATDGGKALASKIYDKILKPVLVAAKIKGTNASNVIETCYRAGKSSTDKARPPPGGR
jgi:predicted nuclease with TOPRIM domain